MVDKCIVCGKDVSDLGVHVCFSCAKNEQIRPWVDKLQKYQEKLKKAEQCRKDCLRKLRKLHPFHFIKRRHAKELFSMSTELVEGYADIIQTLEIEIRYNCYRKMGGNASPNIQKFFEQK